MRQLLMILLAILCFGEHLFGQVVVSESMGTAPSTTPIATHESNNAFDQDQYTYSGSGDVRNTSPSSGYNGASGLANIFITNVANRNFLIVGINTSGCTSATLQFGIWKSGGAGNSLTTSEFIVEYSNDGGNNWTTLDWGGHTGGSVWILSSVMTIPNSDGLRIQFRQPATPDQQVRIDDVTLTGDGPCASPSLPIVLSSIRVDRAGSQSVLSFSTATESNNDYFSIQRSSDGLDFTEIGQVKGAGASYEPREYRFTDERPLPGKNYYRLKQVGYDGKFSYSPVVTVTFGNTRLMTLAPVPTTETLRILLEKPLKEDATWQVFDLNGRLMFSGLLQAETTEQSVPISIIPQGAYLLRLLAGPEVMTELFRKEN